MLDRAIVVIFKRPLYAAQVRLVAIRADSTPLQVQIAMHVCRSETTTETTVSPTGETTQITTTTTLTPTGKTVTQVTTTLPTETPQGTT